MNAVPRRFIHTGRSGDLLFIALVIVAYVSTFSGGLRPFTPLEVGGLIAAGVVYVIVAIYGTAFCERVGAVWAVVVYFVIQISLGATIVYLSYGLGWLIMLPLAGQGVELLPRRWMLAVVLLAVAVVMPIGLATPRIIEVQIKTIEHIYSAGYWAIVSQASIQYLVAVAFVVLLTHVAVREREARAEVEQLAAELGAANRQLRQYAAQVEELATTKERNRLAREIHDSLGHYLTVINVQIEAARAVMEDDRPRALDALRKAQTLAQEGLAEVRCSVAALRASPSEGRSLAETVAVLVDECRAAGIATEFVVTGAERPLPPQVELTLYRAAQEGLTNVRKHANASSAGVALDYRDDGTVQLTVQDNGVGAGDPSGGFGLLGVRERVQLLGGRVHIRTAPGEGFTLKVELPG